MCVIFFFFKQKTAYEMRIRDWSSDVCSSDLEDGVDNFNREDVHADAMVQVGLRSRFAPRGRYSWQEETLRQLNRWLGRRYRAHWPADDHRSEERRVGKACVSTGRSRW